MRRAFVTIAAVAALAAVPGAARAGESGDAPCTIEPGTSNSVVVDCEDIVLGSPDCYVYQNMSRIRIEPAGNPPFFTVDPTGGPGNGVHCPIG